MAFKLSTGLRNALLGTVSTLSADDISAANSDNSLNSAAGAFITSGFRPGMVIIISGFTGTAANNALAIVTSVTATKMIVSGPDFVDDAAGESVTITSYSQALKEIFDYGVIHVYAGAAPADADAVETGTQLLEITKDSAAFTAGTSTNGLRFDDITIGVMSKNSDIHSGLGLDDGTAGYYRLYTNLEQTGSSSIAIRAQGTVGTSGTDFILSSTSISTGATTTLDSHSITLPAA